MKIMFFFGYNPPPLNDEKCQGKNLSQIGAQLLKNAI